MLNYIAAHGIRSLPNYLREIVNGRIALKRIERFLRLDDQVDYLQFQVKNPSVNAIEITDASFSWATTSEMAVNRNSYTFFLTNINLNVPKRRHLCLYGPVGSGKTALLLSILGQTQCFKGEVRMFSEKLSYVAQTPWLQNASIRENILFSSPFDRKRYYETLIKCQLAQDISQLAEGEHTMVGDNGRQLSGGQKQRIQLARAVYANSDIYLFDDLFSSLDSRVVRTIFNNVLNDMLKNKTVIFITRHLHLLSHQLVALLQDGQIVKLEEHGKLVDSDATYKEAVDRSKLIGIESKGASKETAALLDRAKVRESLEMNQEPSEESTLEEDDSENDEESERLLFQRNTIDSRARPLSGTYFFRYYFQLFHQNILSGPTTTSYTSLISLLEKCDQNNNQEFDADRDGTENDDEYTCDPESKLFRKYSQKYKKKFASNQKTAGGLSCKVSQKRSISRQTYADYIRASGGWPAFTLMVGLFAAQTTTSTFASWWLSYWLNKGSGRAGQVSQKTIVEVSDHFFDLRRQLTIGFALFSF